MTRFWRTLGTLAGTALVVGAFSAGTPAARENQESDADAHVQASGFLHSISDGAQSAPRPVGEMAVKYDPSQQKWVTDAKPLFGEYFGSGDGSGTGALAGRISWDLYEDQSRDDRHPAFYRGFIERDGERHAFQIVGVYIPELDGDAAPDPNCGRVSGQPCHPTRWQLLGTIVFEDTRLVGSEHALVTGTSTVESDGARGEMTVWVDNE